MIRYYMRIGRNTGISMPIWLAIPGLLLWCVGLAVVAALWLLWQLVCLPFKLPAVRRWAMGRGHIRSMQDAVPDSSYQTGRSWKLNPPRTS